MKATINKSQLMKRAWGIYRMGQNNRKYRTTFADALRRAWRMEKNAVAMINRVAELPEPTPKVEAPMSAYDAGLIEYYQAGSGGRIYYGD